MATDSLITLGAALWFIACWCGYSLFARRQARQRECLASALHRYRTRWMLAMLTRENRIGDAALIASLERNASFLASTAMFTIAGLVTILASVEQVYAALMRLPINNPSLQIAELQLKFVMLLVIYAYAFFTLTWALRQFGFAAVLLGAAPTHDDYVTPADDKRRYAANMAQVIDRASHSYNYGLRAYYFSLAVLPWLLNTWLFVLAVAVVVLVLYRREFHSRTLEVLLRESRVPDLPL